MVFSLRSDLCNYCDKAEVKMRSAHWSWRFPWRKSEPCWFLGQSTWDRRSFSPFLHEPKLATPKFTQHQQDSKYPAVAMGNLKAKASKASRKDFGSASRALSWPFALSSNMSFLVASKRHFWGLNARRLAVWKNFCPKETLDKDFEKARPSRTLLGVFFLYFFLVKQSQF